jgi:hypothetical protein
VDPASAPNTTRHLPSDLDLAPSALTVPVPTDLDQAPSALTVPDPTGYSALTVPAPKAPVSVLRVPVLVPVLLASVANLRVSANTTRLPAANTEPLTNSVLLPIASVPLLLASVALEHSGPRTSVLPAASTSPPRPHPTFRASPSRASMKKPATTTKLIYKRLAKCVPENNYVF